MGTIRTKRGDKNMTIERRCSRYRRPNITRMLVILLIDSLLWLLLIWGFYEIVKWIATHG
jgi:hypothetical protein